MSLPTMDTALRKPASTLEELHSRPEVLQAELKECNAALTALSIAHYNVHVANAHVERDVKQSLQSTAAAVPRVASSAARLQAGIEGAGSTLNKLLSGHSRLSVIHSQQSVLAELLETPALLDSCLRAGMYDEALDICDFATGLFFTHKLWDSEGKPAELSSPTHSNSVGKQQIHSGSSATDAKTEARAHPSKQIIGAVVADVRRLSEDMRAQIFSQLSCKVSLPQCFKLLAYLRRLYTQQAVARKRLAQVDAAMKGEAEHAARSKSEAERGARPKLDGSNAFNTSAFILTLEEEYAIICRVRSEFLQCRDAWHRSELDAISKHNTYQYILRVLDLQRVQWADICSHYVAVSSSLRANSDAPLATVDSTNTRAHSSDTMLFKPASAAGYQAEDQVLARRTLSQWLSHRISWFVRLLASSLPLIDDCAHIATLMQQATFVARRAGKLGTDYTHLVIPLFTFRIEALLQQRLQECTGAFETDLLAWQWAYKRGYELEGKDSAVEERGSLDPPQSILAHAPLAELLNSYVAFFNAVRLCFPLSSIEWLRNRVETSITSALSAIDRAINGDKSPIPAAIGARTRGKAASGQLSISDDDANAIRRLEALMVAFRDVFVPYVSTVCSAISSAGVDASGAARRSASLFGDSPSTVKEKVDTMLSTVRKAF